MARWKAALAVFVRIQGRGVRVPESFWGRVAATFTVIGENHALDALHGDIADLLRDYYDRNGQYRLSQLVEPAVRASIASGSGNGWLIELGRSLGESEMMLRTLMMAPGVTPAERIALQRDMVEVLARQAQASFGDAREYVVQQDDGAREQLISLLLDAGDVQEAAAEFAKLQPARVPQYSWERDTGRDRVEILLAAKTGTLAALLERYRAEPEKAPQEYPLRDVAGELRQHGEEESARLLLEFLYDREIRDGHLTAANFIGLAEVKLQRGDTSAALALLNRMALVADEGFDALPRAAELLAQYGKTAEAAGFFRQRIRAVPWDANASLELARNLPAGSPERAQLVRGVVADSLAAYRLRAQSARLAGGDSGPKPGTELAALSAPVVSPATAGKPYQVESRIVAVRASSDPEAQLRLWREALAIAPADERVQLGSIRAALALRRDSLALALSRIERQPQAEFNSGVPSEAPPPRWAEFRMVQEVAPRSSLTDDERASLAESLAAVAERLDDLAAAQDYLRTAIRLTPEAKREPVQHRLDAVVAEANRRARNAARQPVVKDAIEQAQIVAPRIPRSGQ